MRIVPALWGLSPELLAAVGNEVGRQRLVHVGDHVVAVLHRVPNAGEREREPVVFWRGPNGLWRKSPGRDGAEGWNEHLQQYHDELTKLDSDLEIATTANEYFALLRSARPVKRATRNLNAMMVQLKEIFPNDPELRALRERSYELERFADVLVDDADAGMQSLIAQRAEQQAVLSEKIAFETHRLNMLSAFFLPIAAVTGIFGMNLSSTWEETQAPIPFLLAVAASITVGFFLRGILKPQR